MMPPRSRDDETIHSFKQTNNTDDSSRVASDGDGMCETTQGSTERAPDSCLTFSSTSFTLAAILSRSAACRSSSLSLA